MNRNITFKRISSNGEVTTSFNLKKNDVNSDRLAMLFKLNSESIFLYDTIAGLIVGQNVHGDIVSWEKLLFFWLWL